MELIKNNIHMNKIKRNINTQITVNDDIILPEENIDINYIVASDAYAVIDSTKIKDGRITLKGRLCFKTLYGDSARLQNLSGEIPIDEVLYSDNVNEDDCLTVYLKVDNSNISIINNRKISIHCIVNASITSENLYDIETTSDIERDDMCMQKESAEILQIAECKKDILRLKKELEINKESPEISELLWDTVNLYNTDIQLESDSISITGNICITYLYKTDDKNSIEWQSETIPFSETLPVSNVDSSMIADVLLLPMSYNIQTKNNQDGETRLIDLDLTYSVNIKVYKEITTYYIKDIYSTKSIVTPILNHVCYNTLVMKNLAKCKINDKFVISKNGSKILQICGNTADLSLDTINKSENGIIVSGTLTVNLMYVSGDDSMPINIVKEAAPFTHTIEVNDNLSDTNISIRPYIEQISTTMAGTNEIDIKATIALDTLVIKNTEADMVTSYNEETFDMNSLVNVPSIICYIAKENDTLFSIAKQFRTTIDELKNINNLSDHISKGEMITIIKQC